MMTILPTALYPQWQQAVLSEWIDLPRVPPEDNWSAESTNEFKMWLHLTVWTVKNVLMNHYGNPKILTSKYTIFRVLPWRGWGPCSSGLSSAWVGSCVPTFGTNMLSWNDSKQQPPYMVLPKSSQNSSAVA